MTPERVGPYRIDDVLGSGGMGEVYAAYDERLDRRVAIKAVLPGRELSGERRERLLREARAAAALSHAAVAQVHDIVTEGDRSYIVMEYVEGETLAEILARGPLDLRTALRLGEQIAEGLHAAHQRGIVHRDLKAENVMVTPSGQAKILDFGLAKRLDPSGAQAGLTAEGMVMGTCHAMSPEQAEGRPVDHRSDLFALGTLLYRMVTGEHPFAVDGPMATMRRIVAHEPPSPHELRASVPPPVSRLVMRLLTKEPGGRPASADEVAGVLRAQAGRSASDGTEATRSLDLGRRTPSRRRRRAVIASAVVLVAAAVCAVLAWRHLSSPPLAVVAVARPEVAGAVGDEAAALAAAAVREALLSSVVGLEGLVALAPEAVDGVAGTPAEVARAVAADEVLTATVDATGSPCRVVLRRLAGVDGHLLWTSGVFEAPADQLRLLADTVTVRVRQGYAGHRAREGTFVSEVSPQDYTSYLEAVRQLDELPPGVGREELIERLEEIRRRSPRFLEAYLTEASQLRYLSQLTRRPELLDRARAVAHAARELAPEDPRALLPGIEAAIAARDLDRAEQDLALLERLEPGEPHLFSYRSWLARERGDPERALDHQRRAVERMPSWQNLRNLADVEVSLGRFGDAQGHLRAGLERAPGNPYLLTKLAQLELTRGSAERAEAAYEELAAGQPNPVVLCNLGTSRLLLGRYAEAAEAYGRALELAPDDPETLLGLADARSLEGDPSGARGLYLRALDAAAALPGDEVVSAAVAAQAHAHLGNSVEAAAAVDRELRLAPDDPQTLFDAALVYALIGDTNAALVNATKALEAGFQTAWFELPWFASVEGKPGFRRAVEQARQRQL